MKIGMDCFQDEQIRLMIRSHGRKDLCEVSGMQSCLVYDTEQDDYLEEYFKEILDVFTVAEYLDVEKTDRRVDYLRNHLGRWKLFSVDEDCIQRIIETVCAARYEEEPKLFTEKVTIREWFSLDIMEQQCILKNQNWDAFCNQIKHVNRFHCQQVNFDQFETLLKNMVVDFPTGSLRLYRSRICNERTYHSGYPREEMGAPPETAASAGRTNSEGIPCLYLSGDEETTFHEVRARENDHVSLGEFDQVRDIKIVDLSLFDKIGPFSIPDFDMLWFAINIEIIRKIGDEVSKPMRRFDRTLDYVPTQYICDYIKYMGYDGIKFKSTLAEAGMNYAIFDETCFECQSVKVVHIRAIRYTWGNGLAR